MGEYSAWDDPTVDQLIESHLQRAVEIIRSRMEPHAIILRGSFGRGEGTIIIQNGQMNFLSDYEFDIAISSPRYRSLFAELSRQLTTEFGVETSLRWVRPDYIRIGRVGPMPMGPAPITISLYESRYGSRTLYGHDVISDNPPIDPGQILPMDVIRLVLNRMAESLYYMPGTTEATHDELETYYWVNKTILACAESLLLLWGQYHFSYEERGRRFASLANTLLDFMPDQAEELTKLIALATEFKLRPSLKLLPESVRETWLQTVSICEPVFRLLTEEFLGFSFNQFAEFPEQFIQYHISSSKFISPPLFLATKLLQIYKYLRRRRLPRGILLPYYPSQVVYAVVPLIFVGWANNKTLPRMLSEARRWLKEICPLEPPLSDSRNEWDVLRRHTLWAWKNFCYS
jgi:hypothetical protein